MSYARSGNPILLSFRTFFIGPVVAGKSFSISEGVLAVLKWFPSAFAVIAVPGSELLAASGAGARCTVTVGPESKPYETETK